MHMPVQELTLGSVSKKSAIHSNIITMIPAATSAVSCVFPPTPLNTMLLDSDAPYTMHEKMLPTKFPTACNQFLLFISAFKQNPLSVLRALRIPGWGRLRSFRPQPG